MTVVERKEVAAGKNFAVAGSQPALLEQWRIASAVQCFVESVLQFVGRPVELWMADSAAVVEAAAVVPVAAAAVVADLLHSC